MVKYMSLRVADLRTCSTWGSGFVPKLANIGENDRLYFTVQGLEQLNSQTLNPKTPVAAIDRTGPAAQGAVLDGETECLAPAVRQGTPTNG